jgi:hypothetical protein
MSRIDNLRLRHSLGSVPIDQSLGFEKPIEWEAAAPFRGQNQARTTHRVPDSVAMIVAGMIRQQLSEPPRVTLS